MGSSYRCHERGRGIIGVSLSTSTESYLVVILHGHHTPVVLAADAQRVLLQIIRCVGPVQIDSASKVSIFSGVVSGTEHDGMDATGL
jgi:hypothetical protein